MPRSERHRSPLLFLVVPILVHATTTGATRASAQEYTLPDWKPDSIHSAILNETRHISVALPVGYDFKPMANERYPVLITLDDAYGTMSMATRIINARVLSGYTEWLIPPMIIVSIESGRTYVRDMTPPPVIGQPSPRPGRGGAPAFATFISDELLPWLSSRYRTSSYTIVQGHSLAGLFAAWIYGQRPDKIGAVLALSPTLMWSDQAYQQVLDGIRSRRQPGRFFVAAGETEGTMIPGKVRQFLSDIAHRPPPSTDVLNQWYPHANHGQAGLLGFTDGLRSIFRPIVLAGMGGSMSTENAYLTEFNGRRAAYVAAAPAFGFPLRLPLFFTLAQATTLATPDYKNLQGAIPILCTELRTSYPGHWAVPVCDGYAHLTQHSCDSAAAAFTEGLRTAQQAGDSIGIGYGRQGAALVNAARRQSGCS